MDKGGLTGRSKVTETHEKGSASGQSRNAAGES